MAHYYNECDPFLCEWLSNLISSGALPPGEVDCRPIEKVCADDLRHFRQCHFFAGIGGWSLAAKIAEWPEDLELWTGSPPCQPFSVAGKFQGIEDKRHLWPDWFRLIQARRPRVVMAEQVSSAVSAGWFDQVAFDLETLGYAIGAAVIPASAVGAWHKRNRLWIVADTFGNEQGSEPQCRTIRRMGRENEPVSWEDGWRVTLSRLRTLANGIPRNVGGTDAARNAIVPQVAAEVMNAYLEARYAARADQMGSCANG